jgi:hypothetical protein
MNQLHLLKATLLALLVSTLVPTLHAQESTAGAASKPLFNPAAPDAASRFGIDKPSVGQLTVAGAPTGSGVDVSIQPGPAKYPSLFIKPQDAPAWDLSAYGHVQAVITNLSGQRIGVNLRIDNKGDWHKSPWSDTLTYINPGETKTLKTIFGYSFGKPAYPLKPGAVNQVVICVSKVSVAPVTFHIDSIEAAGSAGETPSADTTASN